jgi:NADPH:quinone reductase-like Zn-dependent oxidoreductase
MMRHDAHAFAEIVKLVQDGLLDAKTGWTLPLEDVSRAHVLVEGEKTGTGKVVLKLKA